MREDICMLVLVGHYIIVIHPRLSPSLDSPLVVRCAIGFITLVLHHFCSLTNFCFIEIKEAQLRETSHRGNFCSCMNSSAILGESYFDFERSRDDRPFDSLFALIA